MEETSVLVVGETPSLGRALVDLLEADGVSVRYLPNLGDSEKSRVEAPSVIVVASNSPYCSTARRWLGGEFSASRLVVVGSRDPMVSPVSGIYRISLPLQAAPFLQTVRLLLAGKQSELN